MGENKPSNPGTAGHSAKREADRLQERFQQERASRSRLLNALLGPSARQKRLAAQ